MNPDPAGRLYTLFSAAREMDPAQREPFLERECAGQPELKARLLKMLEYTERSGGLLSEPPWRLAKLTETQPDNITSAHVFQVDQIVSSRYRITRFINLGGMGEVYEAHDQELDCRVALKTIRPELAADEQALARFKREIQLQREVAHENVCVLYDFGRHEAPGGESVNYLSMQYLAGETLSQKLKRDGKFSPAEALPLAMQIAAGLDAAHRAQILHRDLKSANVMLVPGSGDSLRAVVTDFGLARRIAPPDREHTLTKPGDAMGTLDYMAPELLAGGSATVASDVYAFGIILYEMMCGKRPFGSDLANVAAFKRAQGPPRFPEESAAVDRRWQRVTSACLDPDPARRPTLIEVAGTLSGSPTPFGSSALISFPVTKRFALRRSKILAGILALLSFLGIGYSYYWRTPAVKAGTLVHVTDMINATQDSGLDVTAELFRNQIRQSAHLRPVDESKVARAKSLVEEGTKNKDAREMAREVARRTGASLVISSTLVRRGEEYALSVDVERVGANPLLVRKQWSEEWKVGGKQQIFGALKNAAEWVRRAAGESSDDLAERDLPPEDAASSSWEALSLYHQAEVHKQKGEKDGAIADLQRAVELDPGFALAHVLLADILNGLNRQEEAFTHYRLALDAAEKRRLSRWEALRLRGVYALDTGDYLVAESALSELRSLYPTDSMPAHYLAGAYRREGKAEQALKLEQEASAKDPAATPPVVSLVILQNQLGRWDQAESSARQLAQMGAPAMAAEYQGLVRVLRGDIDGARVLFESVRGDASANRRSHGFSLLAQLDAETGHYQDAIQTYQQGLSSDLASGLLPEAALKYLALASLHARLADRSAARNYCLEAIRLLRTAELHRRVATILARAGYTSDAQHLLDDLGSGWPGPVAEAARSQIRGEILLSRGDFGAALRELQSADRLDPAIAHREYLAHAYAVSGDRERALFLYDSMVQRPALFWQYADCELPGLRAAALLESARLARALGDSSRAATALHQYFEIRPNADDKLPETLTAKKLLAGLPAGIH